MWSDQETLDDCLGYQRYVVSLAEVCLEPDIAPLTLGVFGSWGSGKSSLMSMLKGQLDSNSAASVRTLWFNAWRYEGKEEIQPALIYAIIARLEEDKTLLQDARATLTQLKKGASVLKLAGFIARTAVTLTPDIQGFLDCFNEEANQLTTTMQTFESSFRSCLKSIGVDRVVVFIDDLDRCSSRKIIETFETIKLFLNVPQCTFVIGADSERIEAAIRTTYGPEGDLSFSPGQRTIAEEYLEKIVQLPFRIPEQGLNDIACYVALLVLRRQLSPAGWEQLLKDREKLVEQSSELYGSVEQWITGRKDDFINGKAVALRAVNELRPFVPILARGLRGNPRQIKRFLNILEMRRRLARANKLELEPDILVKLLILEYTWRDFFADLTATVDLHTGHSDLADEVADAASVDVSGDQTSATLASALSSPELVDFMRQEPSLKGKDLTPYLFLSQTALRAARPVGLAPPEEAAKAVVNAVASEDRIVSKAAARNASRGEKGLISAIVKGLGTRLLGSTDRRVQVNIVNGLVELCSVHQDQFPAALVAIRELDVSRSEPTALACVPFLKSARKAGNDTAALETRLREASPMVAALLGGASNDKKKKGPKG